MISSLRMRASAVCVVLLVIAAACSDAAETTTSAEGTTETPSPTTATSVTVAPPTTIALPIDEVVPIDPGVLVGALDNGLTYYVRENSRPGGRAELRLVVNAGSALETPEQSGGAHFLEHMLFNGTERFPENELTRVLEGFGARFGPDVNAYTSFDETVYELGVATDDPAVLELAFDVLLEWATRATIEQGDVEAERGVVLEEWRLRDAGVGGRIAQVYEDILLRGTGYEGLAPIGEPEALRTTNADTLRRFYEDWYRPDLMAIVAVGDFDSDRVVALIEERFTAVSPPANPQQRSEIAVGVLAGDRVTVFGDPDQPTASVEIYFPSVAEPRTTVGDRFAGWAQLLANEMIATRLTDDITRGDAPFLSVVATDFNFTRRLRVTGVVADVASVDVLPAVVSIATEVERARLHGFNDAEFVRAVASWSSAVEQFYAGRASTQDVEYAGRYVTHYLEGGSIPSADDEHDLDLQILSRLTPQDAHDALLGLTDAVSMATVVIGPDDGTMPSELAVSDAIAGALAREIAPRPPNEAVGDTLLAAPDPVVPAEVNVLPFGITELVYPNGVTVQFIQTDISVNQVAMGAISPGGLSRLADGDVAEGFIVADVVSLSGAGAFDRVSLDTFLADRFVSLQPYIDVVGEGMFATAATEDLETLFQLIHLTMAAPRFDEAATNTVLEEMRPFVESPEDIPGLATTLEVIRQRWGDEPRYSLLPEQDELEAYDAAAAAAVFTDRFGDAGDFVFAFAGDFPASSVRELADTYLGTLPGTDRDDGWLDFQIDPPGRVIDETVGVGDSEQGFVTFLFTNELEGDARRSIQAELLALIADTKIRDRIREALAATYSPFLSVGLVDEPDELIESFLQVSGDPAGLDQIVDEALAMLRSLVVDGPSDAELATAKEQLRLQYELVSNEWWIDQMLYFASRPNQSLESVFDSFELIDETTGEDIRLLAGIAFPADSYVLVRQIPR